MDDCDYFNSIDKTRPETVHKYRRTVSTGWAISMVIAWMLTTVTVHANENADADVLSVEAFNKGENGWTFKVTVGHPDTGWEDYCNGWDVVTDQGVVLKKNPSDPFTRLLLHPHENEQPFTRSQSGLKIPPGTRQLTVRAHDLVDGFGGKEVRVDLSTTSGPGYVIIR